MGFMSYIVFGEEEKHEEQPENKKGIRKARFVEEEKLKYPDLSI